MLVSDARVTVPRISGPPLPVSSYSSADPATPVPLSSSDSWTGVVPLRLGPSRRVAPLWTAVSPAGEPSADALSITSTPALTFVTPSYVLVPVRVNVPVPSLVKPPGPLSVPEKVVELPRAPVVSVYDSKSVIPLPASEPTLRLPSRIGS